VVTIFYLTSMFIFISAMIMAAISILRNIWLDQNVSTPKFIPLPNIVFDEITFVASLGCSYHNIIIL